MKTAGQLLREKRIEKELLIEDIARKLKLRPEYLHAVENDNYKLLPGITATRGFLRNYARALYLNPETILAMFRRDYEQTESGEIIPKTTLTPLSRKPRIISANLVLALCGFIIFFLFLGWQIHGWLSLPKLELYTPVNGEVYIGKIVVRGKTTASSVVTINNQKVLVDQDGNFSLELLFSPGVHSVLVQVENRSGRLNLVERTFQVTE